MQNNDILAQYLLQSYVILKPNCYKRKLMCKNQQKGCRVTVKIIVYTDQIL